MQICATSQRMWHITTALQTAALTNVRALPIAQIQRRSSPAALLLEPLLPVLALVDVLERTPADPERIPGRLSSLVSVDATANATTASVVTATD